MSYHKPSLIPHIQRGKLIVNGLVGAWPLYEGAGTKAYNVSGDDARHGTWTSSTTRWTGSEDGTAGNFTKTGSEAFQIDNSDGRYNFPDGVFSLCSRVSISDGTGTNYIWDNRQGADDGYTLYVTSNTLLFICEGVNTITCGFTMPLGDTFHNIVVTNDQTNGTKLYLDSVLVNSNTTTTGTVAVSTQQNLCVGGDNVNASFWRGKMSDLRIYDRVLTQEEISLIAAGLG